MEKASVSNRDVFIIVNAVLNNMGILSPTNILDPSKLQCQRKYWRERLVEEHRKKIKELFVSGSVERLMKL